MRINDVLDAVCDHGHVERSGNFDGPLTGLRFALKDCFDLEGTPTGNGSPDWLATHPVPARSASVVERLLNAGADLVGKTKMDEMAWSLVGENAHYGTPVNVAAPGRVPGGSSSGSAAVVAGRVVDFAIGSDTAGSVRLPASFCGIYGIRPTHGRVDISGGVPLAPSYDTVGWLASDPDVLARVGKVVLPELQEARRPKRAIVAKDLFAAAGDDVRAGLSHALDRLDDMAGEVIEVDVVNGRLDDWVEAFRIIQSSEVWGVHGDWVRRTEPDFGPGIRGRFEAAAKISTASLEWASKVRGSAYRRMRDLLGNGGVLVVPSAPSAAIPIASSDDELQTFRVAALSLQVAACHSGLPQLSMPLGTLDGLPIGLSVIGEENRDEDLLQLAQQFI